MEHPLLINKFESESNMMKDFFKNKNSSDYIEFDTESPVKFYCIKLNKLGHNIYLKSDDSSDLEVLMEDICLGILVDHYFIYVDTQTFNRQIFDLKVSGTGLFYNRFNACFYCILQTGFFRYDIKDKTEIYKSVGDFIWEWEWVDKENYTVKYSFDSGEFHNFNFITMS